MPVMVYSMPNCPQCSATHKLLEREEIEYQTIDVTTDAGAFAYVQSLGYLKAPVVVIDEAEHWAGFRPDKIKALATQLAADRVLA
jgi:glutaredoxin-like protein NrdH